MQQMSSWHSVGWDSHYMSYSHRFPSNLHWSRHRSDELSFLNKFGLLQTPFVPTSTFSWANLSLTEEAQHKLWQKHLSLSKALSSPPRQNKSCIIHRKRRLSSIVNYFTTISVLPFEVRYNFQLSGTVKSHTFWIYMCLEFWTPF